MGWAEVAQRLLEDVDVDPNRLDSDGDAPLHYAAQEGHMELLRVLIHHRANVRICTATRRLLQPDLRGGKGQTALILAAKTRDIARR